MAMTLRLTPEDDAALERLAQAQGVSKHEAALRAIHNDAERVAHRENIEKAVDYALVRYASLLDRLAQ